MARSQKRNLLSGPVTDADEAEDAAGGLGAVALEEATIPWEGTALEERGARLCPGVR